MSGLATQNWVKKLFHKSLVKQTTYSTDEQVVGTWIDGKPIYRRVYTGVTFTTSKDTWVDTNIAIPDDFGSLVHAEMINATVHDNLQIWVNSTKKIIQVMMNRTSALTRTTDILILEYTKSTDTATS